MFLTVEWAKRWLPALFLLLSLILPWWTLIQTLFGVRSYDGRVDNLSLSFPWGSTVWIQKVHDELTAGYYAQFYEIPYFCFVSALVVIAGLCGLSSKSRTRSLGGMFGIIGIISYFILVFPISFLNLRSRMWGYVHAWNPYFGTGYPSPFFHRESLIWFLSVGFYFALAGSLMLLSPLIRTLMERLRKRL
jgi:hypothetical protein